MMDLRAISGSLDSVKYHKDIFFQAGKKNHSLLMPLVVQEEGQWASPTVDLQQIFPS